MTKQKQYLGDGVYIDFDGFHVVLTAENGISAQETIYLDDQVIAALREYLDKLTESIR